MYQSEHINELATALSKAQADIQPAIKDSINPYFKSKYADLASVWSACKTHLTKNGLAVVQTLDNPNGQLVLITTLVHSSGQWIRSSIPVISAKQDAQSIGSAITYMRRYSLAAMVGVTTDEDDDGNAASIANGYNASKPKEGNSNREVNNSANYTINDSEVKELQRLLNECDSAFVLNVNNYLKSIKVNSLYQLPRTNYDILNKKISNRVNELNNEVKNSKEVVHA